MVLRWYFSDAALVLYWRCTCTLLVLHWYRASLVLHEYWTGRATLHWFCAGTSLVLQRAIPLVLHS